MFVVTNGCFVSGLLKGGRQTLGVFDGVGVVAQARPAGKMAIAMGA